MIITFSGENGLLLQAALQQHIQDFNKQYGDLAIERFDAADVPFSQLSEAVQALPFLAIKRLVVVDSPSANKDLAQNIETLLAAVPDSTDLYFVEPKFDKRSSLYKTLKKKSDFKEFNELAEPQLTKWLVDYAKEQGGSLPTADARLLIGRIGTNQLRLKHELDKLLSFNPKITKHAIEELVMATPQSSTFDLLSAALHGQVKRALELYADQRRQRIEPQAILALLGWQLHILALVKAAADRSVDQIAKDAKLNPYSVRQTVAVAKRLTMTTIKELITATTLLDYKLKRESIDADEALQNLLLIIGSRSN